MKKILVAVDGSESARHAAEKALELADLSGGSVTLCNVVSTIFIPAEVPITSPQLTVEMIQSGERLLEELARALGRPGLARRVITGNPAEALVDLANAENFDLIVISSKGRGAVSRVLLGSTTDRVVHISNKPVLVVR
jgi:nucleotide-binding universal stress UspA family protein